ncbi:MAG: hypothetical protein AB1345_01135 [Chloroflexota bacterium]
MLRQKDECGQTTVFFALILTCLCHSVVRAGIHSSHISTSLRRADIRQKWKAAGAWLV